METHAEAKHSPLHAKSWCQYQGKWQVRPILGTWPVSGDVANTQLWDQYWGHGQYMGMRPILNHETNTGDMASIRVCGQYLIMGQILRGRANTQEGTSARGNSHLISHWKTDSSAHVDKQSKQHHMSSNSWA